MLFIHMPLDFHTVSPFSGVLLVLCVIDIFFLLEYLHATNKIKVFCKLLYKVTLIYLIVNDVLLLGQIPSVSGRESIEIFYFIGNKFEVSYMHLFFAVLYFQVKCNEKNMRSKFYYIYIMHLLLAMLISSLVECSTGILGSLILFIWLLIYRSLPFLFKPVITISLVLIFGTFFIYYEAFLTIPFVQYVIVDILGEDLTLTGRTYIYIKMIDLLNDQPWLGYGNGTASFFTQYYVHENLANTQNGLLNDFIEWGIIGVITMLLLLVSCIKNYKYENQQPSPFTCLVYTYIVLSCIEITLGLRFLAILPFCAFAGNYMHQKRL